MDHEFLPGLGLLLCDMELPAQGACDFPRLSFSILKVSPLFFFLNYLGNLALDN